MGWSTMGSLRFLLALAIIGVCGQIGWAQSPTYDLGTPPTAEELHAADISISPTGKELPPGSGNATQGAQVYADKCATCHGATGAGAVGPILVKGATPKAPCVMSPCISDNTVMGIHAPYATVIWDYINRGMPFSKEGSLKPDEVYAVTAFLLFKNGVIKEDDILDAQSLPQVKMPNHDAYALPEWKHGAPRIFTNKP